MRVIMIAFRKYTLMALLIGFLAGCGTTSTNYKSSLVDFLFPYDKDFSRISINQLETPVRIGIAFVPDNGRRVQISHVSNDMAVNALSEKEKYSLLKRISKPFESYDFVESIEIIPSDYLIARGSFDNLKKIKNLANVDVVALVSYDQSQYSDADSSSVLYWTIVGAYFVKAEKNETQTLMDIAIFDVDSKSLILRAAGTSSVKTDSSIVNRSEQLRKDSSKGYEKAAENLKQEVLNKLKTL